MNLESWGISDIGGKRALNEDFFFISDEDRLYVIADGMGGHAGGEYASKRAVMTVREVWCTIRKSATLRKYFDTTLITDDHERTLKNALTLASNKIAHEAEDMIDLKGMGTTCIALYIHEKDAYVAHVGDSRLYRFRNNEFTQLTEDHSLVNEHIKMGLISKDDAKRHLFKNVITRSIGVTENLDIDTLRFSIHKNDIYLLATDGLSNLVPESAIKETLATYKADLPGAASSLIREANARGGDDNVTVVLVRVLE